MEFFDHPAKDKKKWIEGEKRIRSRIMSRIIHFIIGIIILIVLAIFFRSQIIGIIMGLVDIAALVVNIIALYNDIRERNKNL